MSDSPLDAQIRAQQAVLIMLQAKRITDIESELRKAQKRIHELEQENPKSKSADVKAASS